MRPGPEGKLERPGPAGKLGGTAKEHQTAPLSQAGFEPHLQLLGRGRLSIWVLVLLVMVVVLLAAAVVVLLLLPADHCKGLLQGSRSWQPRGWLPCGAPLQLELPQKGFLLLLALVRQRVCDQLQLQLQLMLMLMLPCLSSSLQGGRHPCQCWLLFDGCCSCGSCCRCR